MDDKRIGLLKNVTLKSLGIKQDKWQEFMGSEEHHTVITSFFENPNCHSLVISRNDETQLVASLDFPKTLKNKAVYFMKKDREIITEDGMRDLCVGDVASSPVDVMRVIVEEVIFPLQTNERNMSKWPKVVSEDVCRYTHQLRSEMVVMGGQLKGKVLLPLPENAHVLEDTSPLCRSSLDSKLVHAVETVIIDWAHQVAEVLNKNSAQPIFDGLNPLPKAEFDFWSKRLIQLECIHEQLINPKALKMAQIVETAESAYWKVMENIYKDVEEGLREAKEIVIHLKPLKRRLDEIEQLEYSLLRSYTGAVVHTVALIWANSMYYHPERVIVILQEICSLFINMTRNYLGSDEVLGGLQGQIEEMLEKIRISVGTLVQLKESYNQCKLDMDKYFKDGKTMNWDFPSRLVFKRLDDVLRRLRRIEDIYSCSVEFLKLKNVEARSVKRGAMGSGILDIYDEFLELIGMFAKCRYDPVSNEDESFVRDVQNFQNHITDYEIRLGTIFCHAFKECATPELAVKLIDMFGTILERPQIQSQIASKYKELVKMFSLELDQSKLLYDAQMAAVEMTKGFPPIAQTMPHVVGQLKWAQEIQDRIQIIMNSFKTIHHPCMDTEEAKLVFQKYDEMMDLLDNYCQKVYSNWTAKVDNECQINLNQPVLIRDPETYTLTVNFRKLVTVLKEVKYLRIQGWEAFLPCAAEVFTKHERFQKHVASLDLGVFWYNRVKTTALPVEFSLIREELESINEQLANAESSLCWNSEGVLECVQDMSNVLHNFQNRIEMAKDNVKTIHDITIDWATAPMFERKDIKEESLLDLDMRQPSLEIKYNSIKESGEKIVALIEENKRLFRADEMSDSWIKYVDYIDNIVLHGFFKVVYVSLSFLVNNMHAETKHPLFEVRFELENRMTTFYPSLDSKVSNDFSGLVKDLILDIYKTASLIPRLSKTNKFSYQEELEGNSQLTEMRDYIINQVLIGLSKAHHYSKALNSYADLWKYDREEFMEQFLMYGKVLTQEVIQAHIGEEIPQNPPTLKEFKEMIDTYEELYTKVKELEDTKVLKKWFQINIRPFKHALLNIIKRWSWMFKKHLIDRVINSLRDLETLITEVRLGLTKTVEEGDYEGLVEVMGHVMRVKVQQVVIDKMFDPLKDTIALLKEYGEEFPNEVHAQLQDLPEQWNHLKKTTLQVKQNVAPLQANEVKIIRQKCQEFQIKVQEYREQFKRQQVFLFSFENPYEVIDTAQNAIAELEAEMDGLCQSASLFEVNVPDYKQLVTCRREIVLLKRVWDMIHVVKATMDNWKTTPWKDINVDEIEMNTKMFAKDIAGLDKDLRTWNVYTVLDSMVKNMTRSLQAVRDLQNPAIKDRDRLQLNAEMSEKTTFEDVLKNLNTFEHEPLDNVDNAVNSLGRKGAVLLISCWCLSLYMPGSNASTPKHNSNILDNWSRAWADWYLQQADRD